MGVKTKPKTYETSDGQEFPTKAEAETHERGIQILRRYEDAKREYEHFLAEQFLTADGEPFSFDRWTYYLVVGYECFPHVVEVNVSRWDKLEIDTTPGGETDIIVHQDTGVGSDVRHQSFRLRNLYATRNGAVKAQIKRAEEFVAEKRKALVELRNLNEES